MEGIAPTGTVSCVPDALCTLKAKTSEREWHGSLATSQVCSRISTPINVDKHLRNDEGELESCLGRSALSKKFAPAEAQKSNNSHAAWWFCTAGIRQQGPMGMTLRFQITPHEVGMPQWSAKDHDSLCAGGEICAPSPHDGLRVHTTRQCCLAPSNPGSKPEFCLDGSKSGRDAATVPSSRCECGQHAPEDKRRRFRPRRP